LPLRRLQATPDMTVFARVSRLLAHAEEGFMAVALAFRTVITFIQVCLRYLFGTGLVWSLEATTYAFAWLVLVGMAYGVRTKSHIAVDIVTSHLPPAVQRVAGLLALLLCLVYCAFMFYGSYTFVGRLAQLGNDARDIPLPRWLLSVIMPVAFALLGLRFVQAGWKLATGRDPGMAGTGHS
jgi:C4-dicarboxylate transporter DctQ subunit